LPKGHHQSKHAHLDAHHACRVIALKQVQFLKSFENPEWEIDFDTRGIYNLAFKLVRQSFAYRQMVVFGAPARSLQVGVGLATASARHKFKVFARYKQCQAMYV
jgi:hypothetical protein